MSTPIQTPAKGAVMTLNERLEAIILDIGEFERVRVNAGSYSYDGLEENDILALAWPALRKHHVLTLPDVVGHEVIERPALTKDDKPKTDSYIIARMAVTFRAIGTEESATLHCEGMAALQDDKALAKAISDANKNLWRKLTQAYARPSTRAGKPSPARAAREEKLPTISEAEGKHLWSFARDLAWEDAAVGDLLGSFGFVRTNEITKSKYPLIMAKIESARPAQ